MKRRKHPHVPAKKTLRLIADKLWSLAVRNDCNHQCVVCRKRNDHLHAHHLVPRMFAATRYDIWNGIALCFYDHTKNPQYAPHQNAAGWMAWLSQNMPARAEWYIQHRHPQEVVTKSEDYYLSAIRGLREYIDPLEFEQIAGLHFSQWLHETLVDEDAQEA